MRIKSFFHTNYLDFKRAACSALTRGMCRSLSNFYQFFCQGYGISKLYHMICIFLFGHQSRPVPSGKQTNSVSAGHNSLSSMRLHCYRMHFSTEEIFQLIVVQYFEKILILQILSGEWRQQVLEIFSQNTKQKGTISNVCKHNIIF